MLLKKFVVTALAIAFSFGTAPAQAQLFGFNGATEATQMMNHAELLLQKAEQKMMNIQLSGHTDLLTLIKKNTSNIDESTTTSLSPQDWAAIQSHFLELAGTTQQANSLLAMASNMAANFSTIYGSYIPGYDFIQKYRNWSKITMGSIQNAVRGTALQQGSMLSRDFLLQQLPVMGASTTGQLQALQVLIQLASINAQQMKELQTLITHQLQIQQFFLAQEIHKKSMMAEAMLALFNPAALPASRANVFFRGGSK